MHVFSECEQERQRAEDEKKKAEEEKRLRSLLEKDSVAVKDQLAKVLQRLEALESKQKSDKKEVERVRNEVIQVDIDWCLHCVFR